MENKKIVVGILIIVAGALLLLNKMGIFLHSSYQHFISWQTLLIAIGAILLFEKRRDNRNVGLILIFVGVVFLFPRAYLVPVALIALGIFFIIKTTARKKNNSFSEFEIIEDSNWKGNFAEFSKNKTEDKGGVVKKEYFATGSKEKWTQGKLKNLEIEAVLSGVELDFSQAELADDIKVAAHIKISSVFSGVIVYVPDDWNIMVQKTGVFGGFNDNRPNRVLKVESDKYVVLELEAVFGGGELRCYE